MRVLALVLGTVAAVGFTAAVSAGQATDHIQFAQAQNTGAQQGAGTGATQQGSSGNRSGGAASTPSSEEGGRSTVRTETGGATRTTVRERSEGARVSVHGGGRRTVGVRSAGIDNTVVIKRKKAARYVHSEPSVVIKKRECVIRHTTSRRRRWSSRNGGPVSRLRVAARRRGPACVAAPPLRTKAFVRVRASAIKAAVPRVHPPAPVNPAEPANRVRHQVSRVARARVDLEVKRAVVALPVNRVHP